MVGFIQITQSDVSHAAHTDANSNVEIPLRSSGELMFLNNGSGEGKGHLPTKGMTAGKKMGMGVGQGETLGGVSVGTGSGVPGTGWGLHSPQNLPIHAVQALQGSKEQLVHLGTSTLPQGLDLPEPHLSHPKSMPGHMA